MKIRMPSRQPSGLAARVAKALFLIPALACILAPASLRADEVLRAVLEHAAAHPDGKAFASFDRSTYELEAEERKHLPIGVFDSGIGGLTVLEALLSIDVFDNETLAPGPDGVPDFAEERFLYLGDQANMPYGRYASEDKADYLRELVLKDALFLLGNRWRTSADSPPRYDKPPVKAIVIACNTATAVGLDDIRAAMAAWDVPVLVVGVVEAGARGVLESRRSLGRHPGEDEKSIGAIGVMATVGTCRSGAYPALIQSTLGRAGYGPASVTQQGKVALAALIEGNPAYEGNVAEQALADVRELVEIHRDSGEKRPIETLVLGCTHYPLILTELESAFETLRKDEAFAPWIAPERIYVDPAEWSARELFRELASAHLRLRPGEGREGREDRFYLSVPHPDSPLSESGERLDPEYQYGRDPGNPGKEDTVVVGLTREGLPEAGAALVREKLPEVWRRLPGGE